MRAFDLIKYERLTTQSKQQLNWYVGSTEDNDMFLYNLQACTVSVTLTMARAQLNANTVYCTIGEAATEKLTVLLFQNSSGLVIYK